jgi:O-antigen/teichoic acid export membrane protein
MSPSDPFSTWPATSAQTRSVIESRKLTDAIPTIVTLRAAKRSTRRLTANLMLDQLQMNRAVGFLLAARMWQILAYPVTALVIALRLTPQAQGFYYTFASLLGLQVAVELGLGIVITTAASHEWSRLSLDSGGYIQGSPGAMSRLVSIGRFVFRWYAVTAIIFVIGVGLVGWFFFSGAVSSISWRREWTALVVTSGVLLWTIPFNALLEGCNQVEAVNRSRFTQAIMESGSLWGTLLLGGGLWAAPIAILTKLARMGYLIGVQFRHFFQVFGTPPSGPRVEWRTEIWPMQWRLGVAGLFTFLYSSILNPVMFRYQGAVVAGQMGMTLQLVMGLQAIGMAWLSPNVPRLGMLIAERKFDALDHGWLRTALASTAVVAIGAAGAFVTIWLLPLVGWNLESRVLRPLPAAMLLAAGLTSHVTNCFVMYLRAHKREPILAANIVMALLNGVLVWQLGRRFGPTGAAGAWLVQALLSCLWIGLVRNNCRRLWHHQIVATI